MSQPHEPNPKGPLQKDADHGKPGPNESSDRHPLSSQPKRTSGAPLRSIRITRQEAADWLFQINDCLSDAAGGPDGGSADLISLRNALEDACWLARWQREDVRLELCPTLIAGLLESLVQIHVETSTEMADAMEDIVKRLSAG